MSHVDLLDRFDDISLDFFNGEVSIMETIDALDELSEECENTLTNILNGTELQNLAKLLIDIADFEESLLDACSLSLHEEVGDDDFEVLDVPQEYIDSDAILDEPCMQYDEGELEEDYIEPITEEELVMANALNDMSIDELVDNINALVASAPNNFASDKQYEQMRKEWVGKREAERKNAIKTEKETPLEERYKAAMTSFKELQEDKSQSWKLDDEGSWLAEDLERWGKEALEWRDIFDKYYTKLAKEIYKKADKVEANYETPITDEDINIEEHLDDSELSEEEVMDVEERAEEGEQEIVEELAEEQPVETTEDKTTIEEQPEQKESSNESEEEQTAKDESKQEKKAEQ